VCRSARREPTKNRHLEKKWALLAHPWVVGVPVTGRSRSRTTFGKATDDEAGSLGREEAFAYWSQRIAQVLDGHDLPERRLGEWVLFNRTGCKTNSQSTPVPD
jgi:hypothetical protein